VKIDTYTEERKWKKESQEAKQFGLSVWIVAVATAPRCAGALSLAVRCGVIAWVVKRKP
jgi:hypothetical protein